MFILRLTHYFLAVILHILSRTCSLFTNFNQVCLKQGYIEDMQTQGL